MFIGSSRIYRQIDINYFDSLNNKIRGYKTHSFNLGAPATFAPQSYYLYNNFLKSEISNNCKVAFIELTILALIEDDLMHQERTTYWLNLSDLYLVFNSTIYRTDLSFKEKANHLHKYFVSYLECILGYGHFGEELFSSEYYKDSYIGKNHNGYFPLDCEFEISKSKDLVLRKKELNLTEINARANESLNCEMHITNNYDSVHLNYIKQLIFESKKRNINLIFVVPPRAASQQLINLANQIDVNHIINLSNFNKHPDFYSLRYSFDNGHFNSEGAELFTKSLFEEYENRNNFY